MLDLRSRETGSNIAHENHPWTKGQLDRMNRTIKDATVKRYHHDDHDPTAPASRHFVDTYNFGRRLKTLTGLTPFELISKCWLSEPERFETRRNLGFLRPWAVLLAIC